nr:YdcF family protein [Lysinibacillus timonensis]
MPLKKIVLSVSLLFIIFFYFVIFSRGFLVVNEKPVKSDVIIVLSGGPGRIDKGAELYHQGFAEYVLLSNSNARYSTKADAIELGVPESQLILEEEATSTYTNATYSKMFMEERGLTSAIVVSTDFHMRRTKLTFDRVFEDTEVKLTYVAAPRNGEIGDIPLRAAVREYIKLIGYVFGLYHFIDWED